MTPWRTTWILLALVVALFAFIVVFERGSGNLPVDKITPTRLLSFKAADVTNIAVHVTNQLLLRVVRTNATSPWALTVPISYPAQQHAVEWILAQLENLQPQTRISQDEMTAHKRTSAEYGLDLPAATVTIQFQGQRKEIHFGARTPLGDQIFAQVLHEPEVFTAPAALFNRLPRAVNDWRDTTLIDFRGIAPTRLEVRSPGNGFAIEVDQTNKVFALTKPTPARADAGKVDLLVRQLAAAQVTAFINDNPRADLESYGLQPVETEFAAGIGTNDLIVVQFGKSPTNDPGSVYARRMAQTNIVLVSKELLDFLQQPHKEFRDLRLMNFDPATVDSVEVVGLTNFMVRRSTNDTWVTADASPMTIDAGLMKDWLDSMARLTGDVEADVVTDFKTLYGLDPPARQYVIRAASTNSAGIASNRVVAELHLGSVQDEKVFARRPDEATVYAVRPGDIARLPYERWQLQPRRVWSFTTNQVSRLTVEYRGKSRTFQRSAANQWNYAPGSQGIIRNPLAIEETVHHLGELRAAAWTARGEDYRLVYGFKDNPDAITLELKNGDKPQTLRLEFGNRAPNQVPYGLAVIDGQTRIFEIPVTTFLYIVRDLFNPLASAAN
ncbi:MAG: hypothetical protein QOF48_2541 [Verrucomicrobiota bacterium]|jgi:hypothetical protein